MLKIIGIEIIAALMLLLLYIILCVKEKWYAIQSEKRWRKRMESRMAKWNGDAIPKR
ncbi:hypothetical protein [Pseudoramibacter alactolyticus]|uniref:hypothetical protein n=1 Tax=Pseudoramibacter alactolyticus TaxID=113287 RepID=UPI00248E24B3|nr:hypothetical protein [Pseudoramibacter alactolyticus]